MVNIPNLLVLIFTFILIIPNFFHNSCVELKKGFWTFKDVAVLKKDQSVKQS